MTKTPEFPAGKLYHNPCHHKKYRLNCELIEEIWQRGQGHCEICGVEEDAKAGLRLVIDHLAHVGEWAVRGLLCGNCNTRLQVSNAFNEQAAHYLARPWFKKHLAAKGLVARPEEPPIGTSLRIWNCLWERTGDNWRCRCGNHRHYAPTWDRLMHRFGPINIHY